MLWTVEELGANLGSPAGLRPLGIQKLGPVLHAQDGVQLTWFRVSRHLEPGEDQGWIP